MRVSGVSLLLTIGVALTFADIDLTQVLENAEQKVLATSNPAAQLQSLIGKHIHEIIKEKASVKHYLAVRIRIGSGLDRKRIESLF